MANITPFRFTVFSDSHSRDDIGETADIFLDNLAGSIIGDPGDFIIETGDYNDSPSDNCPQGIRDRIDEHFGSDYRWIPVLGNHDIRYNTATSNQLGLLFLRNEWSGDNINQSAREAIRDYAYPGPDGCSSTQFYFFHKGIMFVCMNWYWDGTTNADADQNMWDVTETGGTIVDAQITWLTNLFRLYPKYPKLVFGHSNAFAFNARHSDYSYIGGSSKANRDLFWLLLEQYNAIAYIHGHTHIQAFNHIDNSYYNGGAVEDSWSYGTSKVPQVCSGSMQSVSGGDVVPAGMTVDVDESSVTFNFYKRQYATKGSYYLSSSHVVNFSFGGRWYYTQNKFGTTWFDNVDNTKGWTVDFNLTVSDVQNSGNFLDEDNKANGAGIYVNDGTNQEIINFLPQTINFHNAKDNISLDTTLEHDYRLIGKNKKLKLFSKSTSQSTYSEIADISFSTAATRSGNATLPNVFEDASGNRHAVWMDDGNGIGTIYYSKFEDSEWSVPEEVLSVDYPVKSPSILVDINNIIYVIYECSLSSGSIIGLSYKNNIGWSSSYHTGSNGDCKNPKIVFDSKYNICAVWEDSRNVYSEIYIDIFDINKIAWTGESKVSTSTYGSCNPSITSYMDTIFITWTHKEVGSVSDAIDVYHIIKIAKFNSNTKIAESITSISSSGHLPDYSSVLTNVSGRIFVVWQDDQSGSYKIYFTILSPSFDILYGPMQVNTGHGMSKYPVLSEHSTTGDIYIAWQDYKEGDYTKFVESPLIDSLNYNSPIQDQELLNSALYIAVYQDGLLHSSNNGSFDIELGFSDERNNYYPSLPPFFGQELPILYQSNLTDEYYYVNNSKIMSQARCAFYDLSRHHPIFEVNSIPEEYSNDRDLLLNKDYSTKEIRFGDFSNVLNVHYILKNIKIYTDDAVEPYSVKEITASDFSIDNLTAHDAVVNNYGDIWAVGTCGVYYFINRQGRLLKIGPSEYIPGLDSVTSTSSVTEQEAEINLLKQFKAISFDMNHNIYMGGNNGVRYSLDPVYGFKNLDIGPINSITSLSFDTDNKLFVGSQSGLQIFTISELEGIISAVNITFNYTDVPTQWITSLQLDSNNCMWIGTMNGLYRFYKGRFIRFTTENGLSSSRINDIAIRNTAIRYIATPNGVNKMVGFNIEKNIQSDSALWNNNVKSVLWKEPNILFAGTMNRLNQIIIDDVEETYSVVNYIPNNTQLTGVNDLQTFYILSEEEITDSDVLDVYINGNYVRYGYVLGRDMSSEGHPRILRFEIELKHDDIVDVVVRKDLNLVSSFGQTAIEKTVIGDKYIRVQDFAAEENGTDIKLYTVVEGDENEVKINDSTSSLPYDKIHLDTTPPHFIENAEGISFVEQIDRSIVKVSITGATDSSGTDVGSGIDKMIVSNYSNFTTNGITAQSSIPYSSSYNHNIGSTLEVIVKELTFDDGQGSAVNYCDTNELYASTSLPAVLYKYNWVDTVWEEVYSYGEDHYIDFVSKYNNKLFVSVGHATSSASIYIYDDVSVSAVYTLTSKATLALSESRAYASHILNGKFYIGSGIGDGNEYVSGMGTGGTVYLYADGTEQNIDPSFTKVVESLDENIYDLSHVSGKNSLLAATGGNGYIYEIDVDNEAAYIIYNGNESIISLNSAQYGSNQYIFAGGISNGIIRRSLSTENSFDISFRTIPSSLNAIKVFTINSIQTVFASVGSILYYLTESGSWMWKYTHTEEIEDFTYDTNSQVYYIISSTGITRINPLSQTKIIYLKLIDRAGNETVLDTSVSVDASPFMFSITISDLVDFVNENRLLELDDYGNIQYTLRGDDKFYSGNKIEQEKGEYLSEIFDGTNDIVKWQNMSWECTEFSNTQVLIYVRTSTSRNDILAATWIGPYTSSQSSGVDLSAFYGQYIQFKADLISTEKGISPSFHSLTIRAITAEAIHFFTTNFVMPHRIKSGIITSQKIVPVSADIVFGINTTNSVDWSEYQEVDENRLFNINQIGTNLRVGIKLISPSRSTMSATTFGEYGPYNSNLYANTIDFDFTNNSGVTNSYHFKISLYEDVGLSHQIYSVYSSESQDGFSVDGAAIPSSGKSIIPEETVQVLFTVPGSANIECDQYYYVKIEYIYDEDFVIISDDHSFVSGCTSTFIDNIEFDFTNNDHHAGDYHFRIKFYEDAERINEYKTVFSGNDKSGWFDNDIALTEAGALVLPGETVSITYRTTVTDFESDKIYYLTVEAHDGSSYIFTSNSYTFQVKDVQSSEACGEYTDVPIVKNFGIMIELDENEFVTLNV